MGAALAPDVDGSQPSRLGGWPSGQCDSMIESHTPQVGDEPGTSDEGGDSDLTTREGSAPPGDEDRDLTTPL